MKSLSKKSQRGYSLIELSIALAIVGVVIAGSIVGVQALLISNNVNKTIRQTNTAVGRLITKFVRESDWSEASLSNLTATGFDLWDDTNITDGGGSTAKVTHFLGGRLFVEPLASASDANKTSYGIAANQGVVYTVTGVPVGGCADLAAGLDGLATALTITNEAAIDTAPNTLNPTNAIKDNNSPGKRFNATGANALCSSGGKGTVTISALIQRR